MDRVSTILFLIQLAKIPEALKFLGKQGERLEMFLERFSMKHEFNLSPGMGETAAKLIMMQKDIKQCEEDFRQIQKCLQKNRRGMALYRFLGVLVPEK